MVSLYTLRFFASIGVYLHHLNYPLSFGTLCVTFFFVMSGFTSAYSISKKDFKLNKSYLKKYYISKLVKLYPLYFLTFLFSIPVMSFFQFPFGLRNILINLTMVQSYYPNNNEIFYFNGLAWFLSDIMLFYLITPFIFYILNKFKLNKNNKVLVLLILVLYVISIIIAYKFKGKMEPYSFGWWLIYISPFYRIFDYIIGFLLGFVFTNIKYKKQRVSRLYIHF